MNTKYSPALLHDLVDCIGAVRRLGLNARLPLLDVTQDLATDMQTFNMICAYVLYYYTILYYTILYYTILFYSILYFTILYYTIL